MPITISLLYIGFTEEALYRYVKRGKPVSKSTKISSDWGICSFHLVKIGAKKHDILYFTLY